ncbi:preprotein translocase subunit SecE [Serpentinimonas raichei]|jgi:preprotein translocase subunit SecE|uniref:Preprotein translocase subunit SecE n=1 Tax=Serpentinimonas raichei TaxID=1458425 RepID=A0A060NJV4_9BURK|nr:preprotein translocase subunit SecE [Serpentinimonas raichei]BAO81882.1 preprotein translocase subunit SecE [Serpentinimonas raichei]
MASPEVETVSSGADKAKLAAAVVLAALGFTAFFMLEAQGALVQWAALLISLVAGAAVFFVSESGRQLIGYGQDAWRETQKVVWPARREAIQMTAYVFAFVFVIALFLWLSDSLISWVLYDLILGWR